MKIYARTGVKTLQETGLSQAVLTHYTGKTITPKLSQNKGWSY